MITRLLERLLYRRPRGGEVRRHESPGVPYRLSRGTLLVLASAVEYYGLDFFERVFPDTDIVILD